MKYAIQLIFIVEMCFIIMLNNIESISTILYIQISLSLDECFMEVMPSLLIDWNKYGIDVSLICAESHSDY